MGACDQADGMKRKELPLLTRVNLFRWVNFNLTRDKKILDILHCSAENRSFQIPFMIGLKINIGKNKKAKIESTLNFLLY